MPHITVKLYSGKSDETKQQLADELAKTLMKITGNSSESVSVEIADVDPENWKTEVYDKEIVPKMDILHKKPGYKM